MPQFLVSCGMGKKLDLIIKESDSELRSLKQKQKTLAKQKRVIALLRIKNSMDASRQELSNYLGVDRKTLRRWLIEYRHGGIETMLEIRAKRKGSKIITQEIHEGLERRVTDPSNSFLGYWDAQQWVLSEYGVKVKYQRIREYLIQYFGTKVKRPRKTHVKKDAGAVALFKNAT